MKDWLDLQPDPQYLKKEREKARTLRKTDWWRAQLQKGICHYCGQKVGAENLTMDHVVPLARGGKSVRSNCVPCCKKCNNEKKAFTPVERILEELSAREMETREGTVVPDEEMERSPEERLLRAIFGDDDDIIPNLPPERRSAKRKSRGKGKKNKND